MTVRRVGARKRVVRMTSVQIIFALDIVAVLEVVQPWDFLVEARALVQTVLGISVGRLTAELDLESVDCAGPVDREAVGGPAHLRRVSVGGLSELVEQARGRDVAVVARI